MNFLILLAVMAVKPPAVPPPPDVPLPVKTKSSAEAGPWYVIYVGHLHKWTVTSDKPPKEPPSVFYTLRTKKEALVKASELNADKQRKKQSPRPDGFGYCSPECCCGCNDGGKCTCGSDSGKAQRAVPIEYERVIPFEEYQTPRRMQRGGILRGGGGGRRGGGGGSC